MTALFQKEKVFLIGITDLPQCENIGEFSHFYYNMWDKKCLAKNLLKINKNQLVKSDSSLTKFSSPNT